MATELNLTEQRERKRLATELHDYLAQLLVVVRMKLRQTIPLVTGERIPELLKDADHALTQSLDYTRSLVAELTPPTLKEFGLLQALLALLAFLLAVTMGMASDRFDARRGVVLEEANTIGTAYLRAGTLPSPAAAVAPALVLALLCPAPGCQTPTRAPPGLPPCRHLRLSIEAEGITWLDEVLVWGDVETDQPEAEHIAPVTPSPVLTGVAFQSLPGAERTASADPAFWEWRRSLVAGAAQAVRSYTRILRQTPADQALIHQPYGGICLIGGMARAMTPHLKGFELGEAFREPRRVDLLKRDFAVSVVEDDFAALTGCAAWLDAQIL